MADEKREGPDAPKDAKRGKLTKDVVELMLATRENARGSLDFALRPQLELLRMNFDAATRFAEQAVKGGFLLNGGALVVRSGYAALFKIEPSKVATEILLTVLAFVRDWSPHVLVPFTRIVLPD